MSFSRHHYCSHCSSRKAQSRKNPSPAGALIPRQPKNDLNYPKRYKTIYYPRCANCSPDGATLSCFEDDLMDTRTHKNSWHQVLFQGNRIHNAESGYRSSSCTTRARNCGNTTACVQPEAFPAKPNFLSIKLTMSRLCDRNANTTRNAERGALQLDALRAT